MVKKEKTPPKPRPEGKRRLAAEKIQQQLQRILRSPEFHASDRQREFLKFVVTETIAGRDSEIKGYTVATQIFGRREDFDQSIDPIVSIQANNLRRDLERYYLVVGQNDQVRRDQEACHHLGGDIVEVGGDKPAHIQVPDQLFIRVPLFP